MKQLFYFTVFSGKQDKALNGIILVFSIVFGGLVSVYLGKDLNWDIANYHYYGPFSFLYHRGDVDFLPSSYVHQYLNPTLDLLTYGLINYLSPFRAEFVLGAIHGLNFWLIYCISFYFMDHVYRHRVALLIASLGIYGPTVLPGIGSFQNDNFIALFILGYVLLQLKYLQLSLKSISFIKVLLPGFLLGCGFGLKLTAAIYVVGAGLSILLLPATLKIKLKWLIILMVGVSIGWIIFSGYWSYSLWQAYHNPFFPFFNHIFQSPYFEAMNWRDDRFLPNGILQVIFYPFYFSWDGRTADAPFQDMRFMMVYVLVVLFFIKKVSDFFSKKSYSDKNCYVTLKKVEINWIVSFFIFSYLIWQFYFSIARYAAPLEMLAPLLIYILINEITINTLLRMLALVLMFYSLIFFMSPIKAIRVRSYQGNYFNVLLPEVVKKNTTATVLVSYPAYGQARDPRPQFYLIPFFPKGWHFVGLPFMHGKYLNQPIFTNKTIQFLNQNQTKEYFILSAASHRVELIQTAKQFGLILKGKCEAIISDRQAITHEEVLLCPMKKLK